MDQRSEQLDREQASRLLKGGLGGAIFAALCCFTPLLVVALAGAGLSAVTGWLDYALFPLLFISLAVVAQALWLRAGRPGSSPKLLFIAAALTGAYALYLKRNAKEARP